MAVSSFTSGTDNKIELYRLGEEDVTRVATFPTRFPQTRLCFAPDSTLSPTDSFATVDTAVHIYMIDGATTTEHATIGDPSGNRILTSIDWSRSDPTLAVAGSLDGTVSMYDIEAVCESSAIQAHEQPVYDVSFSMIAPIFATGGLDGSVRLFDMRDLRSSIIFYQSTMPVQRVITAPFQSYFVGVMSRGANRLMVVDSRNPERPVAACGAGTSPVTTFAWSKLSQSRIYVTHEDHGIVQCDLTDENGTVCIERTKNEVQSFAIGPMMLAVAAGDTVEFLDIMEAPAPLRCQG